jgi:23S rRNA (uracil1939-C5)-methyltransferase
MHAVEADAAMVTALAAARGRARLTAETRDLFRRPLQADELKRFDAVVIDPPRPGAKAQAEALAKCAVPKVVYVSCNPASFARDARILADGGYRLTRAQPIDQFVWSPHTELVATFER